MPVKMVNIRNVCEHEMVCSDYLHTYLLIYSLEQGPSSESNRFSASHEIPHIV